MKIFLQVLFGVLIASAIVIGIWKDWYWVSLAAFIIAIFWWFRLVIQTAEDTMRNERMIE